VSGDDVLRVIGADRIVPVAVLERAADAAPLGDALREGGLHTVEVTLRTDAAVEAIAALAGRADLLVGAGTVCTAAQVDRALGAGARFVVSPGFSAAVVARCAEAGVPCLPGVATASEVTAALDAGVDTVKLFPAEQLGGPAMVRALAGPFRGVRFVPTGGVTADNLRSYLDVPAVLAVGGSWMVAPDLVAAGRWDEVTRRTAAARAAATRDGEAR
jgi:2-dehydro-3-deoxyphosphogluconate aldolase / (4S)-4-hydroxy-2-oxoglutarate aldolase